MNFLYQMNLSLTNNREPKIWMVVRPLKSSRSSYQKAYLQRKASIVQSQLQRAATKNQQQILVFPFLLLSLWSGRTSPLGHFRCVSERETAGSAYRLGPR